MRKGFFLLFSVIMYSSLFGQGFGEIKAFVTDKLTGDTIAGCNAFILKPDSLRERIVISDAKGLCRFKAVPEGFYTLVFSYPGYQNDTVSSILVSAVKTTYLRAKLIPLRHADPGKKKKAPAKTSKRNPVLQGKIIDSKTKETLPFAVLVATGPDQKKCGVAADLDGNYKLELPGAGKYLLECKMIGYHTEIIPLIADSFRLYAIDISLCELAIELLDVTIDIHERGGRTNTDAVHTSDSVFVITGGLPDAIYQDTAKTKNSLAIDSFALYHIRPLAGIDEAATLFRRGKLFQFNDSVFYFDHGGCPQYAFYVKRGNKLIQYGGYENSTPTEILFYKRGKTYRLKSGKATARIKKYPG